MGVSQPITKSAYADSIGVAPAYITKELINNPGCIDLVDCGSKNKVNPEGTNSKEFFTKHYNPDKVRPPKPPKIKKPRPRPAPKTKTSPKKKEKPIRAAPPKGKAPAPEAPGKKEPEAPPIPIEPPQAYTDKQELEKEKIQAQIEQIKIKNEEKRGELFQRKIIEIFFGQLYAIDENQIKTLDVNLAPKIEAMNSEQNSSKTVKILELLNKPEDDKLGKRINQILSSGETERKKRLSEICEDATSKILKNIQREIDFALDNMGEVKA